MTSFEEASVPHIEKKREGKNGDAEAPKFFASAEEQEGFGKPEHGDTWVSQDGQHLVRVVSERGGVVEATYASKNASGKRDNYSGMPLITGLDEFLRQYRCQKKKERVQTAEVSIPVREEAADSAVLVDQRDKEIADLMGQANERARQSESAEEAQVMGEEMGKALEAIDVTQRAIEDVLDQVEEYAGRPGYEVAKASLEAVKSAVIEDINLASRWSEEDDTLDEAQIGKEPTDSYIVQKRTHLKDLNGILTHLETLLGDAKRTRDTLKQGFGESGTASKKEKPRRKSGKGGGSDDGGDGTDEKSDPEQPKRKPRVREERAVPQQTEIESSVAQKDEFGRQELDAFLERPGAREKVEKIKSILLAEWEAFSQAVLEAAAEKKSYISSKQIGELWEIHGLRALEDMAATYLNKDGISWEEGRKIFQTIDRNLREPVQKKK